MRLNILAFADGLDGRRYIALVRTDGTADAVATVEGMPGVVKLLPNVETTMFDSFPDHPEDRGSKDWLYGRIDRL